MGEIGVRAAKAIRGMATENETTLLFELECLGIKWAQLYQYERNIADPGASVLATMATTGYDVLYILTGERK